MKDAIEYKLYKFFNAIAFKEDVLEEWLKGVGEADFNTEKKLACYIIYISKVGVIPYSPILYT